MRRLNYCLMPKRRGSPRLDQFGTAALKPGKRLVMDQRWGSDGQDQLAAKTGNALPIKIVHASLGTSGDLGRRWPPTALYKLGMELARWVGLADPIPTSQPPIRKA